METLKAIVVGMVFGGVILGLYYAFLCFFTQPYEHSETLKRILKEK